MVSVKSKTLTESAWLAALPDAHTAIKVDMHGFPFRFAPPPEWDTRDQTIREHLIYFIVRGGCQAVLAGSSQTLEAGNLCWVCPGVKFRFFGGAGSFLQRFRLSVVREGSALRLPWKFRVFPHATGAAERSRDLVENPPAGRFARQQLSALAVLFSLEAFEDRRAPLPGAGLSSDVRKRIAESVLDPGNLRITPRDLARMAGLSADYFSRLFTKSYGMPPREWLLRQRLKHASGLLAETGERISQIALRLGYPDVYLFSRQFTAEFGHSPMAWRRLQGRTR